MKRNGDIASLFRKHAAKKAVVASSPFPTPAETVGEDQPQEQVTVMEEIVDPV